MNPIYKFFCWAGGANIEVLEDLPTEQNRFFGYGTVICMTALFACLSSGYAFSILFPEAQWFVALPALVWGLFIFVIDRFFIVTISSQGALWRKILAALPRLVLACFLGVIISKPLEFKIFQREITNQLPVMMKAELDEIDKNSRTQAVNLNTDEQKEKQNFLNAQLAFKKQGEHITELKTKLKGIAANIREKDQQYVVEANGTGGSKQAGIGPKAKALKADKDQLANDSVKLDQQITLATQGVDSVAKKFQTEIDAIAQKYADSTKKIDAQVGRQKGAIQSNYKPSILNQQIALSNIENDKKSPGAGATIWFVTLLFIFIEMAPMLLKLMTSAGAYEKRITQIEATYSTDGRLRRAMDQEEYKSNRGLVQRLARSQRGIVNSAMEGWHREQMDKLRNDPQYFSQFFNEKEDVDEVR